MMERTNGGGTNLITLPAVVGLVLVALAVPGFFVLRRVTGGPQPASVQQPPTAPTSDASDQPQNSPPRSPAHVTAAAPTPLSVKKSPAVNPAKPAATLTDVKVLVAVDDTLKERAAILKLAGDRLSVMDRSGKVEILTLPYRSIVQAFYSRSKQPRWTRSDGKTEVARVDLGKMSLFRGERHWLILTTRSRPVFISFDGDVRMALPLIEDRIGVRIQR